MAEQEPITGFGVVVVREDGQWRCASMDPATLDNLDTALTELRKRRSTGAVFGMLAVDDEFFVIVRPIPEGARLLLSDAAAGLDYDVAGDVLDLLRADPPDEDDESLWPAGDLDLLADVGLPGDELEVIVNELDRYPDEQLQMVAQRCGFDEQFEELLDKL